MKHTLILLRLTQSELTKLNSYLKSSIIRTDTIHVRDQLTSEDLDLNSNSRFVLPLIVDHVTGLEIVNLWILILKFNVDDIVVVTNIEDLQSHCKTIEVK